MQSSGIIYGILFIKLCDHGARLLFVVFFKLREQDKKKKTRTSHTTLSENNKKKNSWHRSCCDTLIKNFNLKLVFKNLSKCFPWSFEIKDFDVLKWCKFQHWKLSPCSKMSVYWQYKWLAPNFCNFFEVRKLRMTTQGCVSSIVTLSRSKTIDADGFCLRFGKHYLDLPIHKDR